MEKLLTNSNRKMKQITQDDKKNAKIYVRKLPRNHFVRENNIVIFEKVPSACDNDHLKNQITVRAPVK